MRLLLLAESVLCVLIHQSIAASKQQFLRGFQEIWSTLHLRAALVPDLQVIGQYQNIRCGFNCEILQIRAWRFVVFRAILLGECACSDQ